MMQPPRLYTRDQSHNMFMFDRTSCCSFIYNLPVQDTGFDGGFHAPHPEQWRRNPQHCNINDKTVSQGIVMKWVFSML